MNETNEVKFPMGAMGTYRGLIPKQVSKKISWAPAKVSLVVDC